MANNPYKYEDPSGHKLKDFLQVGKNFVKPSIPQYALDLANTARNTILDKRIQEVKNTKVTNQQEVAEKAAKLLNLSLKRSITVFKPKPCPRKLKWWEKAFIDLGNGIQDFGNGVVKGVETVVESTVDGVVSFAEFVKDFVTDPIGTTANVLSAMWDTIKDPKFWALATTSVVVGLGVASCGSIPVGILVTCIATSAVGEAYDLCIVHRFNLDSFFASRGCKTFMEYIGKQIVVIGADGLKAYLSGKVIERFTKGKGSSTNKLPDNDLIEDSVQDAIEDGISDSAIKGTSGSKSWYNKDGSINYPPNNGAVAGTESTISLKPGDTLGRYGNIGEKSNFVTRPGADASKLSLPPTTNPNIYQEFVVVKEIPQTIQSKIAAWGDSVGGGVQYELPMPIKELIRKGYIVPK